MRTKDRFQNTHGFTLIELLITISAVSLLLGIAIPSYNKFITSKQIRVVTEDLYNYIKTAQSTSLNKQTTIYLSLKTGANWCYGLSDTANCDCATVNSCQVNGVQTVLNNSNYSGKPLTLAVTGFSGTSGAPFIQFQGNRGTISDAGSAGFSSSGYSATLTTSTMGLVSICSDTVSGYKLCTP